MSAVSRSRKPAHVASPRRARWEIALDIGLALLLLATVWLTRSLDANRFVSWDEPAWVYRSAHFLTALESGQLRDTLQTGHPGVLTMWSGAAGLWLGRASGTISGEQIAAVATVPELAVHDVALLRQLVALLPACKSLLPLAHGLILALVFAMLRLACGRGAALVASVLLLCDPFFIGLSRLLHIDALSAEMMLLSLAVLLAYLRRRRLGLLLLAGVVAGMAGLAKAYGVLVAPVALGTLCAAAWRDAHAAASAGDGARGCWRRFGRDALIWVAAALAGFILLWPAMWVAPLATLGKMLGMSLDYATAAGDATAGFYRGQVTHELGLGFYLTVALFRGMPLTILSLLGGLVWLFWRLVGRSRQRMTSEERWVIGAALALALLYVLVMSFGSKKFDRYALPALLALDLAAGIILAAGIEALLAGVTRRKRLWRVVVAIGLLVAQGAWMAVCCDVAYPIAYQNPLVGGPRRARDVLPMGWGEGIDKAAEALTALPDSANGTVATWASAGLAGRFAGDLVPLTAENLPAADWVLLYIGDAQAPSDLARRYLEGNAPISRVAINDIEHAWIYEANLGQEVLAALDGLELGARDHVILTREATVIELAGDRPFDTAVIDASDTASLATALDGRSLTPGSQVALVSYAPEDTADIALRQRLAENGLLRESIPFSLGTIWRFEVLPAAAWTALTVDHDLDCEFTGLARLTGYGFAHTAIQYRQSLGVTLQWQLLDPSARDLHLFMHLVDESGRRWGQRDLPLGTAIPEGAGGAQDGEVFDLSASIALAPGIPPGIYWLDAGLYRLADLGRIEVQRDGASSGDAVRLGPIQVVSPRYPATVDELGIPQLLTDARCASLELLGCSALPEELEVGEGMPLDLYWRAGSEPGRDVAVRLCLVGADGRTAAQWEREPVSGYATSAWAPAETVIGVQRLEIPSDMAAGEYELLLSCDPESESTRLGSVRVYRTERLFAPPTMQYPLDATLGDWCRLVGYDLLPEGLVGGEVLSLTLYWQTIEPTETSLTVFTHLLDREGQVKGQRDSVPQGGARATQSWLAGEYIVDQYELIIDPSAAKGKAFIEVGMYDAATGERQAVILSDGSVDPDRRVLLDHSVRID